MFRTLLLAALIAAPSNALTDPHYECLSDEKMDPADRIDWCTWALDEEAKTSPEIMDHEPDLLLARSAAHVEYGAIGAARTDLKEARRITELLPEQLAKVAAAMLGIGDIGNAREAAALLDGYVKEDASLDIQSIAVEGVELTPAEMLALAECRLGNDPAALAVFGESVENHSRAALILACEAGFGGETCGDQPEIAIPPWIGAMCPKK